LLEQQQLFLQNIRRSNVYLAWVQMSAITEAELLDGISSLDLLPTSGTFAAAAAAATAAATGVTSSFHFYKQWLRSS
jgi:hypothetical protein